MIIKTSIRWLALSLALLASAGPAAAEKTFNDVAAELIDWSYDDCRPDNIPPPPKAKTSAPSRWWSTSTEEVPKEGPKLAPRVVNAGFHTGTTRLSESVQQRVIVLIEQALSRVRMDDGRGILVRNPAEAGVTQDIIHDAFGSGRGSDVGRKLQEAHFDLIMRASGEFIKGGSVLRVHFLLDKPTGGCQKRTSEVLVSYNDLPTGEATPDTIIEQAVNELFKQDNAAKAVKRVAILPPTIDSAVVADESRDALVKALAESLRKAAQPASRGVGTGGAGARGLAIVDLGKGEFFASATGAGDWLAQMRFVTAVDGTQLAIDFFEVKSAVTMPAVAGLIDAKNVPKAVETPITFAKDQIKLRAGKDGIQFQLRVKRPAMAFCLAQEADGETTLLYPNKAMLSTLAGIPLLQPRADAHAYPDPDLPSELKLAPQPSPAVFVMRCVTARERPIGGEIGMWLAQTPGGRASGKPLVLQADEFVKLWSSLRKLSGSREILSVVHVTKTE